MLSAREIILVLIFALTSARRYQASDVWNIPRCMTRFMFAILSAVVVNFIILFASVVWQSNEIKFPSGWRWWCQVGCVSTKAPVDLNRDSQNCVQIWKLQFTLQIRWHQPWDLYKSRINYKRSDCQGSNPIKMELKSSMFWWVEFRFTTSTFDCLSRSSFKRRLRARRFTQSSTRKIWNRDRISQTLLKLEDDSPNP